MYKKQLWIGMIGWLECTTNTVHGGDELEDTGRIIRIQVSDWRNKEKTSLGNM